jgi:hypothetical protein
MQSVGNQHLYVIKHYVVGLNSLSALKGLAVGQCDSLIRSRNEGLVIVRPVETPFTAKQEPH